MRPESFDEELPASGSMTSLSGGRGRLQQPSLCQAALAAPSMPAELSGGGGSIGSARLARQQLRTCKRGSRAGMGRCRPVARACCNTAPPSPAPGIWRLVLDSSLKVGQGRCASWRGQSSSWAAWLLGPASLWMPGPTKQRLAAS